MKDLQYIVDECGRTHDRMCLNINAGKSKVLVFKKGQRANIKKVKMGWGG